jgi:aspartyl-tRNA(Asn)/glutamyl-tRNA(Gln) amidotransferase subunit A
MTELAFLGIAEAARLIAARKLSPVELTEAYLGRIAKLDSQLDSFVTLTAERARAEAKAAEAAIMASGPVSRLHGIPYCLKDIFDTAGIRTTAMSKLLADNVPARDAHCQEKLAAAGGVLLGKNATWEFAHGGPSWDVLFPPARNPWDPRAPPPLSRRASRPRPWAAIPAVRSADRPPPAASPA